MRIELEDMQPAIWRAVILPKSANLGWVHAVIQVPMGWTNSHLHQFNLGEVIISDSAFNPNEFEGDMPVTDERTVTVEQTAKGKTPVLVYQYGFGDSWNHLLTFEPLAMPCRAPCCSLWRRSSVPTGGLRQHSRSLRIVGGLGGQEAPGTPRHEAVAGARLRSRGFLC